MNKVKNGYLVFLSIAPHIPKTARFTLGIRIENKFLDLLELSYIAYFSQKQQKAEKISECIFILDVIKFLISISWEAKLISNKHYEKIAVVLGEIGKIYWGWKRKTPQ